ncbi:hypothetical protein A2962_03385 [Candidatus Woesebacteria bacterium RIFCSPLOWO2_01_FULL_39_61]|uniref:Glycosyltransferase 2-like domain-containing protein n=1 Tax=Candidatus Woesebacteria bacterium RIFCSPHIGHO2_02_FULL_39_13 TaxID=1802505 RepID=A0A1F7Z2J1_9BACT|nr:MAG: hypothetical protein A2692_04470 [Candidatus Woesebacteria bacterium RIFCSPHIGHO2_01_FULL_39_95]OGM33866.1 MAG: hypothetical protein A3D01_02755 [Candidatus Woesebacteria bacterium RIFCSPHIGHO2_02_FULL_39_13]OGM39027.1 MAG: hypothetical protein A3E13_05025 [Candidatus Woesebacteria bacterium RIFCSPHIGHO2_12_FULL_40_20]OGM67532.1 MAG: hypothetical protein A2962_03385 [Candidatus Woesebacteria bacterium RIFCSPLOWO2_01_FULL_39_61]OGM73699.1 MAG: hypothetical protein A3H19_06530 [Candidatus
MEKVSNKGVKGKTSVTVIVIAKNEEKKITDCLKSAKWANEVLVIDTGSSDSTPLLAKKYGAKVSVFTKGGYSDWRNRGNALANFEWVFYVDADERVTPELKEEILEVIDSDTKTSKYSAYAIPRKNIILGKELRHGGWWPDYVKRLYLKNKLKRWRGELHEEPVFEGELGHLKNPLVHIKHDNLSEMVDKTNIWSEIEAKLMLEANHPQMNPIRFLSAMHREFTLRMLKQRAFLDGPEGIIYALYQVYSRFITYAKLWEMQIQSQNSK